ncbi:hypothetical protein BDY24DRAFT_398406 [Mrakia frigida]|uniref:uncharacterized protein n=1 Tax=Mrakia frigida TaxID=29902 RepID=UPI003FCBFCF7
MAFGLESISETERVRETRLRPKAVLLLLFFFFLLDPPLLLCLRIPLSVMQTFDGRKFCEGPPVRSNGMRRAG